MPDITVSMPAHDAAASIQSAIDSVLRQDGVDLELIVVDDGSADETATIVAAYADSRVRLLRTPRPMGSGYAHNLVWRASRAPFIAHVEADARLMPEALRTILAAFQAAPGVAALCCYYFDIDLLGRTTRQAVVERWNRFHGERPGTLDYRTALIDDPDVVSQLRAYRRVVLEELAGFDESLHAGAEYDLALRLLERHTVTLVPDFLYARRQPDRQASLAAFLQHYRIQRRLIRRRQISYLAHPRFNARRRLQPYAEALTDAVQRIRTTFQRLGARFVWHTIAPLRAALYRAAVRHLSWWPLAWWPARRPERVSGDLRIAYYTHAFPRLSETFIQREVTALQRAGLSVSVISHSPADQDHFDAHARALQQQTHYLDPIDPERLATYHRRFIRQRPFTLVNVFLYVLFHQHNQSKWLRSDRQTFNRVLYLAGTLQDRGVTHVHCPWANNEAFVAMLASHLLRIRYSVQGRAYDIYSHALQSGLRERLAQAEFIVTNARYNVATLKRLVRASDADKIRVIYEGVDLTQFDPSRRVRGCGSVSRLLAVGRLVEQKGFHYLLHACRILRDRGYRFSCEIVGGRPPNDINHYIALQRLHRDLALQDTVTFLGAKSFDAVLQKYIEADIFVLPAGPSSDGRRDVTPNVLMEAMAMQLPVVSTRIAGIPEIIEDGVSGLLVAPQDAAALATALIRLIDDPSLRKELARHARTRVEERFDITKNIGEYVKLFQQP
jgi:glycosyltransferase involved in cell wall biosynthesis